MELTGRQFLVFLYLLAVVVSYLISDVVKAFVCVGLAGLVMEAKYRFL